MSDPFILTPLTGLALGAAGAACFGRLTSLTLPRTPMVGAMAGTMTGPVGYLQSQGTMQIVVDADGNVVRGQGAVITGPVGTFESHGGGVSAGTIPVGTLASTGVLTITGGLEVIGPVGTLEALGVLTATGGMIGVYRGKPSLFSYGRGYSVGAVPVGTLAAGGIMGSVGRLSVEGPVGTLLAGGTLGYGGRMVATGPALRLVPSGVMRATAPRGSLSATGSSGAAVEYEAYSMTLVKTDKDGEKVYTSRYSAFPFERIIRFGSKYYGISTDGMFELGGDLYGSALIVADVVTCQEDFGSPQLKRARTLWLGGRISNDFEVSVISDEKDTNEYKYRPTTGTHADNHRVILGRGIRARYWSYRFRNLRGDDFMIDDMTPEVALLRRTA
jgi:hypothetical protein